VTSIGAETSGPDLVLIRHGETEWSLSGQHTSYTDLSLTDRGVAQSKALAPLLKRFRFAAVLSSPRVRALSTARLAGLGEPVVEPDLAEWDYGALEGLTTAEIQGRYPGWNIWNGPWDGGETRDEVTLRLTRLLKAVRAYPPGSAVALVAHGHILRALAGCWIGSDAGGGHILALSTASLSVLGWEHHQPVLECWNLTPDLIAGQ
jgi:broad specificity phosphatase PhoE